MADEFHVTSKAFSDGGHIPRKYTGDGVGAQQNLSPPIEWHNVPEGTETLAIICEDIDAPDPEDPSAVPFVHWVVVNIPPTLKGLPQGFSAKDVAGQEEYEDIQEGLNDFKTPGYRGPMPPKGEQHFEYRVYALDCKVKLGHKVTAPKFLDEYSDHIIAQATLMGNYSKQKGARKDYMSPRDPMDGQALYNARH